MDINDYIESGILERYVLGETSDWENLQVVAMLKKHPQLKDELIFIEDSLHALANGLAITPPVEIENALHKNLFGEVIIEKDKKVVTVQEEPKVIPIETPSSNSTGGLRWAVAASLVLLMASVFYNFYQYKRIEKTKDILAVFSDEQHLLNSNLQQVETKLNQHNDQLRIYHDSENKLICLMGTPNNPDGMAHIYWNTKSNELFVEVNNLPEAPDSLQYQLWAIKGNKPQNAGLLSNNITKNVAIPISKIDSADAFAITLEVKGGAEQPQGQMFAMGKL